MDEYDRENILWLMTASKDEIEDFYNQMDLHDIWYMIKLIHNMLGQLSLEEVEIYDDISDITQAKSILQKFRLKL